MAFTEDKDIIKVGDYVVVQRQGYTKLHKLKARGNLIIGHFTVAMDNIVGERFFETFQMKNSPVNKKFYTLEKVDEIEQSRNIATGKGKDNRNILDDGQSQMLTKKEIDNIKESELSANAIVEKLITNSKTFNDKTEYSQEKYIKKKEKKYFDYVQIRRPTIRLLTQMFYRQEPAKTLGMKPEDLSQILTYANVQSEGVHLLYDSGTSGLVTAAILNAIGAQTNGKLIHMHPGNECQKTAVIAMKFPEEQNDRCINVNLYSVLRHFYQKTVAANDATEESEDQPPCSKKQKLDEANSKKSWEIDNDNACSLLKSGVHSLIIIPKEHPVNIVKELCQFLNIGRNLVVFSVLREPLQDLFVHLKSQFNFININVSSNFMRNYQILPERTHPEINMSLGGYILTAVKMS